MIVHTTKPSTNKPIKKPTFQPTNPSTTNLSRPPITSAGCANQQNKQTILGTRGYYPSVLGTRGCPTILGPRGYPAVLGTLSYPTILGTRGYPAILGPCEYPTILGTHGHPTILRTRGCP